jgi:DNA-binding MarR family transcriptional regulator
LGKRQAKHVSPDKEAQARPSGMEGVRFSDCLCLRLRKGARQLTGIYDDFLSSVGIRITQFGLLAHLEERGSPLALAELAAELLLDPTTLNRNLKPLERQGLLKITANSRDRRVKEISLTPAGRQLLWRAAPLWKSANDAVSNALGIARAGQLASTIDQSLPRLTGLQDKESKLK